MGVTFNGGKRGSIKGGCYWVIQLDKVLNNLSGDRQGEFKKNPAGIANFIFCNIVRRPNVKGIKA